RAPHAKWRDPEHHRAARGAGGAARGGTVRAMDGADKSPWTDSRRVPPGAAPPAPPREPRPPPLHHRPTVPTQGIRPLEAVWIPARTPTYSTPPPSSRCAAATRLPSP